MGGFPVSLVLEGITHGFGGLPVLDNLDIEIPEGKVTVLLGPSGCGKTTILNVISGSIAPLRGSVSGRDGRRVGYLFQEPRLLPWKTVEENLGFVLEALSGAVDSAAVIRHALRMVELEEFRDYYPHELSGGMKQRVAIARAFVYPADIILMDEPFQALDLKLKASLAGYFTALWEEEPRTGVYVTHDLHEALLLGDSIHILSERPASTRAVLSIPVPRPERRLDDERLLSLEKRLYSMLT